MRQTTARQQGPTLQKGAATENLQEKNTMSKQQPAPAARSRTGCPRQIWRGSPRFLLPKIQAFYQSEEGQRLFEEWKAKQ